MKSELREAQLSLLLEECAAIGVPDTLDLWPTIYQQLQDRQRAAQVLHRHWLSRKLVLMPVAAAMLVVLLMVIQFLAGRDQGKPASAAEVLNSLAEVAASQPSDQPTTGYRYIKSQGIYQMGAAGRSGQFFSGFLPKTRETWVAPDGSGRIRETAGEMFFLTDRDRALWQAEGPSKIPLENKDFGPGELIYEDYTRYPTDPEKLSEVIRADAVKVAGPPTHIEMFVIVGDLLRDPGLPPQLRSALYKVAAKIENVELVGRVTDRAGRPGIAVAMTIDFRNERKVCIFDPATSALLEEESISLRRTEATNAGPPVVTSYTTYLESKIVEKLP